MSDTPPSHRCRGVGQPWAPPVRGSKKRSVAWAAGRSQRRGNATKWHRSRQWLEPAPMRRPALTLLDELA